MWGHEDKKKRIIFERSVDALIVQCIQVVSQQNTR